VKEDGRRYKYFDGFVVEFVPRASARVFALDVVAADRRTAVALRLLPLDFDEVLVTVDHRRLTGRISRVYNTSASATTSYTGQSGLPPK